MSTIITKTIKNNKRDVLIKMETYSCAAEVVNDCRTRKCKHEQYDMTREAADIHSSFHGVDSYDEALKLLETGYQPTVEKLKTALRTNTANNRKRVSFENNVHGFAPVVPLALKGVPNSMVNMTMKPMKSKVIDVYYDIAVHGNIDTDTIIKSGEKLLGAIVALEKQGYRVNLYAFQGYADRNADDVDILCVKVKSSDKPLDIKRISFPLTHPAFFRVIGFDWQGRAPFTKWRGSGRGNTMAHSFGEDKVERIIKNILGDNAFYLSGDIIRNKSEEYIQEVLKNDKRK